MELNAPYCSIIRLTFQSKSILTPLTTFQIIFSSQPVKIRRYPTQILIIIKNPDYQISIVYPDFVDPTGDGSPILIRRDSFRPTFLHIVENTKTALLPQPNPDR